MQHAKVTHSTQINLTLTPLTPSEAKQILAKSTQHLSVSFKEQHPEIEWHSIARLEIFLVHDHFGIDLHRFTFTFPAKILTCGKLIYVLHFQEQQASQKSITL